MANTVVKDKIIEMKDENDRIELNENAKPERPGFFKRHGKKIAIGIGAGLLVLLGVAIGRKGQSNWNDTILLTSGDDEEDSDED